VLRAIGHAHRGCEAHNRVRGAVEIAETGRASSMLATCGNVLYFAHLVSVMGLVVAVGYGWFVIVSCKPLLLVGPDACFNRGISRNLELKWGIIVGLSLVCGILLISYATVRVQSS